MRPTRLIRTPETPFSRHLLDLLDREGIAYQIEVWSYRGWYCPLCSGTLHPRRAGLKFIACCVVCGITCTTLYAATGLRSAISPIYVKGEVVG